MTRIHLDLRHDIVGGTAPLAATLIARRTRIRRDGAVVTYPDDLRFPLPGPIDLDPPQQHEAWNLQIWFPDRRPSVHRTITFATTTDADWADLDDVDPRTLDPIAAPPPAAWTLALAALDARIEQIEAAGDAGGYVHRQDTPSAQWSIPHPLGRRPAVALFLPDGTAMLADVYATPTLVVATYAQPTAGSAILT